MTMNDLIKRLEAFHDAWVEEQCAIATGSPDILREKRQQLIAAHKAVFRARQEKERG